jgi:Sulfotransferase domain
VSAQAHDSARAAKDAVRQWKQIDRAYEIVERRRELAHKRPPTIGDRVERMRMSFDYQFLPHYFARPPRWRVWLRKRNKARTLPDFACVGAIKSGTSDLSTYLFQHQCIMLPLAKEITTSDPNYWRPFYPTQREQLLAERQFGKALNGYFAPYMHNIEVMNALHTVRPNAKIVIIVRNPVDRAYSQWKWELFLGGPGTRKIPYFSTFDRFVAQALELYPDVRMPTRCGFAVLQTGIYAKSVQLWFDRFGRDNVHIVRAEDFFDAPVPTVCGVHKFLDLEPVPPRVTEVVNRNPLQASPMDEHAAARLREFYRPKNEEFYSLIGRDMKWE